MDLGHGRRHPLFLQLALRWLGPVALILARGDQAPPAEGGAKRGMIKPSDHRSAASVAVMKWSREACESVIGADATAKLFSEWRGLYVHIPKKTRSLARLEALLGPAVAGRLCEAFGPCDLTLPLPRGEVRARAEEVIRLHRMGKTNREIMWLVRLSARRVDEILAKAGASGAA